MAGAPDRCSVCKTSCRPLRCRKCRQAWYCSVDCQRADWRDHKKLCIRLSAGAVQSTWEELHSIVSNCSIEDAQKDYHLAQEYVENATQENVELADKTAEPILTSNVVSPTTPVVAAIPPRKDKIVANDHSFLSKNESNWTFHIEDLTSLSCYQLRLKSAVEGVRLASDTLSIMVQNVDEDSSLLSISQGTSSSLKLHLFGQIEDGSARITEEADTGLTLRIPYLVGSVSYPDEFSGPDVQFASDSTISCKSCQHPLVESGKAEKIVPTPSGRWDEMGDYLICYPGQATIDFSATITSQKGSILYDDTTLVVHHDDVAKASTCALAIPSDMEAINPEDSSDVSQASALTRGCQSWTPLVGGAYISCSVCCSVLGVVPVDTTSDVETLRIWRHRVHVSTYATAEDGLSISVLQFCAREMIRYAETRAVFGLQVKWGQDEDEQLTLRILSWDSRSAARTNDLPTMRRLVKIIWGHSQTSSGALGTWMFQSNDWCCLPDKGRRQGPPGEGEESILKGSLATLILERDEWDSLRRDLEYLSSLYDPQVVRATVLAKLGKVADASVSLAAVIA